MKMNRAVRTFLIFAIVLMNISCDQISKDVVRAKLNDDQVVNVVHKHFVLQKVENTGAAMSLGADWSPLLKLFFLQIIPIAMLLFLFRLVIMRTSISKTAAFGLACIVGGGIGNIYDRIVFGSVTDFMYLDFGLFHTGIFNMADLSVFLGVILVFWEIALNRNSGLNTSW